MKKEKEPGVTKEYFTFNLCPRNLFEVEIITVTDGKVTDVRKEEPTYLPIALDKIRKAVGHMFTTGR